MRRTLALVVLVPMLLSAGQAQEPKKAEPKQLVKETVLKDVEFDDIAHVLQIFKKSGYVKLNADRNLAQLVFDFYKDGKKTGSIATIGMNVKLGPPRLKDRVDFCVQAIDMDYLALGNGKKNHCRVMTSVSIGGSTTTSENDVDKSIFDFSKGSGSSQFEPREGFDKEVPLFWLVNNTNLVQNGKTVAEIIELHPKANLAICSLRISE